MRKGISPLIAAVLLIAFTMAVAGLAGPFLTEITQKAQGDTNEKAGEVVSSGDVRLEVMSVDFDPVTGNYSVTVRNAGTSSDDNFTFTITGNDDPVQKRIDQKLESGDVKVFEIQSSHSSAGDELTLESRDKPVKTDFDLSDAEIKNPSYQVDSFEDGDISEYNGDKNNYEVVEGIGTDGDYALSGGSVSTYKFIGTDSLDYSIQKGDTWRFNVKGNGGGPRLYFYFALQSNSNDNNGYRIDTWIGENEVHIKKRDGGGSYTKVEKTSGITVPDNEWLEVKVTWKSDGTIEATWFEEDGTQIEHLTTSDTDYSEGSIGWGYSDSSDPSIDNLRITKRR